MSLNIYPGEGQGDRQIGK